jgi:alkylated DNA repair dioxygenase AlkB
VNYYHMDSTLSGHTDNSEQNKEAPLFSFRWIYWIYLVSL